MVSQQLYLNCIDFGILINQSFSIPIISTRRRAFGSSIQSQADTKSISLIQSPTWEQTVLAGSAAVQFLVQSEAEIWTIDLSYVKLPSII